MNPLDLDIASATVADLISRLTLRQIQIVEMLARGHGVGATAAILSISRDTVQRHVRHACEKTQVDNRIQLIVLFAMWKVSNGKDH